MYYQGYGGFINMTFLGVPLFISKSNFYSCPQNWTDLLEVHSENSQELVVPQASDDTVLKVEPNTGALLFASVHLQTNYHFVGDQLFKPSERMIPITFVLREGAI
jgi:hypothetical protein